MEKSMKYRWLVLSMAALVAVPAAADSTPARVKHHKPARVKHIARPQCADQPYPFSWDFLIPGHSAPKPNGCAPPVYTFGQYVGQDPDPYIREQLNRDPWTGYAPP
jgi:hypothetical protein